MTVSTLPVWVILSIVGTFILIVIAETNYHLTPIGKMRAKCLRTKPTKQRNNSIIRLKRRINEVNFIWIALGIYIAVSVCFVVENHEAIARAISEHVILGLVIVVIIWLLLALIIPIFLVGLMDICQKNALMDLQNRYQKQYKVTLIYLDEIDEYYYYNQELPEQCKTPLR